MFLVEHFTSQNISILEHLKYWFHHTLSYFISAYIFKSTTIAFQFAQCVYFVCLSCLQKSKKLTVALQFITERIVLEGDSTTITGILGREEKRWFRAACGSERVKEVQKQRKARGGNNQADEAQWKKGVKITCEVCYWVKSVEMILFMSPTTPLILRWGHVEITIDAKPDRDPVKSFTSSIIRLILHTWIISLFHSN